jgi:hypothetical protein
MEMPVLWWQMVEGLEGTGEPAGCRGKVRKPTLNFSLILVQLRQAHSYHLGEQCKPNLPMEHGAQHASESFSLCQVNRGSGGKTAH